MIEYPTEDPDVKWRVWLYVNTYDVVVGSGEEKYWVDLLGKSICATEITAQQRMFPETSQLKFRFVPYQFEKKNLDIAPEDCVRIGRGLFLKVAKMVNNEEEIYWGWHGRITDIERTKCRTWVVTAEDELSFRCKNTTITDRNLYTLDEIKIDLGGGELVASTTTAMKKIFEDYIYSQYENVSNISFDLGNGCGVGDVKFGSPAFYKASPVSTEVLVKHKTVYDLIDELMTKRMWRVIWDFGLGIGDSGDYDGVYVPHLIPSFQYLGYSTIEDITFTYPDNLERIPNWTTITGLFANKIKLIHTGHKYSRVIADEISSYNHKCIMSSNRYGSPEGVWSSDWFSQTLTKDDEQTIADAIGINMSEYKFVGLKFREIGICNEPKYPITIKFKWTVDDVETIKTVRQIYKGNLPATEEEGEQSFSDYYIWFSDYPVLPPDAIKVSFFMYHDTYSDPDNYWFFYRYYDQYTDKYPNGKFYYFDGSTGVTYDHTDLSATMLLGLEENKVYEVQDYQSTSKYGIHERVIKNNEIIGMETAKIFADGLLKYAAIPPSNEGMKIDGCTLNIKRWSGFPFIFMSEHGTENLHPSIGIKVLDDYNKIYYIENNTKMPKKFWIKGIEFTFPSGKFNFKIEAIPSSNLMLLWDKIKTTLSTVVQNV